MFLGIRQGVEESRGKDWKKRKIITFGDYIYYVTAKMLYHNKTLQFITINSLESKMRYSPTKAVGVRWCVSMHGAENCVFLDNTWCWSHLMQVREHWRFIIHWTGTKCQYQHIPGCFDKHFCKPTFN